MWPTEEDLEPLDAIIDRMNPLFGFPYPMKTAQNEGFPRGKGDPWIGAYTKNGYWYRFSIGAANDWNEIAPEMCYRNGFLLDAESFILHKKLLGEENLKLLIAKNIRGEVIGIASISKNEKHDFSVIGSCFIVEDFRHVGIGSKLFSECLKNSKNVVFSSIKYLNPNRFGLEPNIQREIYKYKLDCPGGFQFLKDKIEHLEVKYSSEIDFENWNQIDKYIKKVTGEIRKFQRIQKVEFQNSEFFGGFQKGDCVGICCRREILKEDGQIPDLLISPLYANSEEIAEVLLKKALLKYYNPTDDYDFDVDYSAIYRRSVYFYIPSPCESSFIRILEKFKGEDGSIERDHLSLRTFSNFTLFPISIHNIFATCDPHFFPI